MLLSPFSVRGCDSCVDFEQDVLVRSHGLGADVKGFAETEAGPEEGGVGCAEDGRAVQDGCWEGAADDGFGAGVLG